MLFQIKKEMIIIKLKNKSNFIKKLKHNNVRFH